MSYTSPCGQTSARPPSRSKIKRTAAAQAQDEVERGLLLDVVVRQGAAVLQLLAGEDEALLIRGDALLVLDLRLHVLNGVRGLDIEGDGLAREGLHEDLHDGVRGSEVLELFGWNANKKEGCNITHERTTSAHTSSWATTSCAGCVSRGLGCVMSSRVVVVSRRRCLASSLSCVVVVVVVVVVVAASIGRERRGRQQQPTPHLHKGQLGRTGDWLH